MPERVKNAKVRNMRSETGRDTDEIRAAFDFSWGRDNLTWHPHGETQPAHLHLFFSGGYRVHAGKMDVRVNEDWFELGLHQYVEIKPGEVYTARIPQKLADAAPLNYPMAGPGVGAVSLFTKQVPRAFDVSDKEMGILPEADWFLEDFLNAPENAAAGLNKKVGAEKFETFKNLVARNKAALGAVLPEQTYAAAERAFLV